jgi:hypothetical protein
VATKQQYQVFKSVYDEELKRFNDLQNVSKLYLTILALFLFGSAAKAGDTLAGAAPAWRDTYFVAAACFALSFVTVIVSIGIQDYETMTDLSEVFDEFGDSPPTDEEFLDFRLADMAAATKTNCKENDYRAKLLRFASWLLVAGVVLALVVLIRPVWP